MERFNSLKITFVFIITIIIPSVFLSAFAYQAIEGERFARKNERHRHLLAEARVLAHDVEDGVMAPARALVDAFARSGDGLSSPLEAVGLLREATARTLQDTASVDTLCPLVLYAPDGSRLYPAPRAAARASDAAAALNEARNVARVGSRATAIVLLEKLERDPSPPTSLAAKLEIARLFAFGTDEVELALASHGLEQIVGKPIELMDPLGRPVVALARFDLARVAAALHQGGTYRKRLAALIHDLEPRASYLPADVLAELVTSAGNLLLAEGEDSDAEGRRALGLAETRRRVEERAERIDEVMSADVRAFLAARRRSEGSDAKVAPLAEAGLERLFLRRGSQTFVAVPIERATGSLVALALVSLDTDSLARRVARERIASRMSDMETAVFEAAPVGTPPSDEEFDVARQVLAPPLEDLEIIARAREASEDVLAKERTTMKLWLIALSVGGVFAGAVVTVRTVVREAKAAELKSDFVTNVTHELRTPLTSIRMFIETLELGRVESEAEQKECLSIMARETDRLTRLIERLLAFSKIESRKWRFKFSYIPPLELVGEAIRVLRQQLQIKEGEPFPLDIETVQDVAPVAVDKDAIVEVLLNLLTNAWKYTPAEGRRLRVVISERRRQVVIDVEDNGIGVPRRDRRRIWKKFERGSNAEKGRIEGSGIGLTLALSIARGHGGTVTLTPLKQGSRFSLVLPKLSPGKPAH